MFCDYDRTDFLGKKEDRFTMIVVPLLIIFFILPWGWWILKHMCSCIVWCCTWEVYVEETDELDEKKKN
jgi:hypothetical protein